MIESLIYKAIKEEQKFDENFTVNDKTYLVRCPKCKRENYAIAVSSGVCAWCGYDANKKGDEGPDLPSDVGDTNVLNIGGEDL